jgi:hypothetical protein
MDVFGLFLGAFERVKTLCREICARCVGIFVLIHLLRVRRRRLADLHLPFSLSLDFYNNRTLLVAKQLKEKCRGGGGGGGTNAQQQQQNLNEEQFLKFFVDDVWEKRVKQMMLIRSLFLYLDRTTVTLSSANASRNVKQQLSMSGGNDPTSPLDDDERRRRSGTDAATTTTTTASKESVKLPLWELSVQQFQKQMDANVDVLRKASSGCLRLIEREREGEKIDRALVKRFTTAMETLKRYGGGGGTFSAPRAVVSPAKNSK